MPLSWKLVIDSTNTPALADFWAEALDYEVEDPSALIERLLAAGHIDEEAVVEHHRTAMSIRAPTRARGSAAMGAPAPSTPARAESAASRRARNSPTSRPKRRRRRASV